MILLLESLHPEAHALLQTQAQVVVAELPVLAMAHAEQGGVQAILTRGKGKISRELMRACGTSLKVVCRCGAGVDTVDVATAQALGVRIIYAPGVNAATTAEHTLILMLAMMRNVFVLMREVKAGNWAVRNGHEGVELRGKTLGIVGMGAIGTQVAQRAAAFGMNIIFYNRTHKLNFMYGRQVEFAELLKLSDVVSVHVPLNTATTGLMDANAFAQMKRGAYFINTSRGAVVDKPALAAALANGTLAGFAGDVFDPQPPLPDDMNFVRDDRVMLTPHVAALTDTTYREVCLFCAKNVLAVLRGEVPEAKSVYDGG